MHQEALKRDLEQSGQNWLNRSDEESKQMGQNWLNRLDEQSKQM
jgi:hypothetical protein